MIYISKRVRKERSTPIFT